MLYQADIFTEKCDFSEVYSDIAVKLHGASMKLIPTEYAEKLHQNEYHPFSIFAYPYDDALIIRVSALTDEAEQLVCAMTERNSFFIAGMKKPLAAEHIEIVPPIHADDIESYINGNRLRISFVTPAMIKSGGKPSCRPDIAAYFYSVILKYNCFENVCIEYSDFTNAFNDAYIDDYNLQSVKYNVSGNIFPGMIGQCNITLPKNPEQNALLKKVFAYATYSGIGGKTGLGMGGIVIS